MNRLSILFSAVLLAAGTSVAMVAVTVDAAGEAAALISSGGWPVSFAAAVANCHGRTPLASNPAATSTFASSTPTIAKAAARRPRPLAGGGGTVSGAGGGHDDGNPRVEPRWGGRASMFTMAPVWCVQLDRFGT